METKKYKLTDEYTTFCGRKLYRIEALKDFADVMKGYKGGYIETEKNLSQEGNCWIFGNAKVFDNARIFNNVSVLDNACVYGYTYIYDNVKLYGNAKVYDDAILFGNAKVYGNTSVFGYANVFGNAKVSGNAQVFGNAKVYGEVNIHGDAVICGNAKVSENKDYIVFKNWWSSGRYFTWTRSNKKWRVGCFYGTGKKLIAKAYKDSELSGREYERVVKYVESILKEQ